MRPLRLTTARRAALTAGLTAFALPALLQLARAVLVWLNDPLWQASRYGAPDWLVLLGLHFTQAIVFAVAAGLLAWLITLIWRKR